MRSIKVGFTTWLAFLAVSASAGEFSCHNYGDIPCSGLVKDLVTDKFTARFPKAKFELVVISNSSQFGNNGGVGYAFAGVAPRTDVKKGAGKSYVPKYRRHATSWLTGRSLYVGEQVELEKEAMRAAVADLMKLCEQSPNCDVLD